MCAVPICASRLPFFRLAIRGAGQARRTALRLRFRTRVREVTDDSWQFVADIRFSIPFSIGRVIFNSLTFLVFFGIVLLLYFRLGHRGQNWMLIIASYVFYGWWDIGRASCR